MSSPPLTVGWVYNLDGPVEHSNTFRIVVIGSVFSSLSFLACLLRIYCRWFIVRAGGWDDAAAALSFVVGTAYCANAMRRKFARCEGRRKHDQALMHCVLRAETRWGLGLDVDDIPDENVLGFAKV